MRMRTFRCFARPGFTVHNIMAEVMENGWVGALASCADDMKLRPSKGWREVRMTIGVWTAKKHERGIP